jgi:RNA polymerase sigma-70 factor (ECF subfamily)
MEAVMSVFRRLDDFDPRFSGALQAYLRQAVLNRIRDELRRVTRRPVEIGLGYDDYAAPDASPLELAIGAERVERYDAALQRLTPRDRELIVARLELQQSYEDIAAAMGKPTANAARAAVVRAMYRLSREIQCES